MRVKYALMLAAAGVAVGLWGSARLVAQDKVTCPVKKIEFQPTATTKACMVNDQKVSFCCGGCPKAFAASPEKFVTDAGNCPVNKGGKAKVATTSRVVLNNNLHYFCCGNCPKGFVANLGKSGMKLMDPVTNKEFTVTADSPRVEKEGQLYLFASPESKATFEADSAKYMVVYGK
jgi:YHS domain-containing protein